MSNFPVNDRVSLYSVACCVRCVANALCEVGSYRLVPPHKPSPGLGGPGAVRAAEVPGLTQGPRLPPASREAAAGAGSSRLPLGVTRV